MVFAQLLTLELTCMPTPRNQMGLYSIHRCYLTLSCLPSASRPLNLALGSPDPGVYCQTQNLVQSCFVKTATPALSSGVQLHFSQWEPPQLGCWEHPSLPRPSPCTAGSGSPALEMSAAQLLHSSPALSPGSLAPSQQATPAAPSPAFSPLAWGHRQIASKAILLISCLQPPPRRPLLSLAAVLSCPSSG